MCQLSCVLIGRAKIFVIYWYHTGFRRLAGSYVSYNNMCLTHSVLCVCVCVCVCVRVCVYSGLTSLSTIFAVISRRCLVATGSSMLTFIVLPH